jgi:hypothetical protein
MWATNGVVMDAGTAAGGASGVNPNTLGITAPGTPFCITDVPITPAPNGYYQLCFGANAFGGGLISYNAYGAAIPLPLQADVNGTIFAIGSGVPQPVINGMCLIGVGGMAVWGSCSGAGSAVTSVAGTPGQIVATQPTGAVVLSLPSTITANLTFSGPLTFTGSVGGTALSAYLAAPPAIGGTTPNSGSFSTIIDTALAGSGFRCVHADPLGTLGVTTTDCGGGGGAITQLSGPVTTMPGGGVQTTIITPTGVAAGSSACPTSITVNAAGQITAIAAGSCGGVGGIVQLTGAVTAGPGSGSQVATIAPVITAGAFNLCTGGSTVSGQPSVTVNAGGQVTAFASGTCPGGGGSGSLVARNANATVTLVARNGGGTTGRNGGGSVARN